MFDESIVNATNHRFSGHASFSCFLGHNHQITACICSTPSRDLCNLEIAQYVCTISRLHECNLQK